MSYIDNLKFLLNRHLIRRESKSKKMKRVFQWKRYLEWRDLSPEEKLSAKRFLMIPIFAYFLIEIFNQNFSLIVLLLIGYVLYIRFNKGGIVKK